MSLSKDGSDRNEVGCVLAIVWPICTGLFMYVIWKYGIIARIICSFVSVALLILFVYLIEGLSNDSTK